MSDLYSELLVKKEKTPKDSLIKYGLMALIAVFCFLGVFMMPILLLVAVGLGVAYYFIVPGTDVEFEYLFVNGELDIDKIMSKAKEKDEIH